MPQKNVVKEYENGVMYHVYNHSVAELTKLFVGADGAYFVKLLSRYLSPKVARDSRGVLYANHSDKVELLAYCIMDNHYHMLIYQKTDNGITTFMRSLSTAYSMYYNKSQSRRGAVFETSHKSSRVDNDAYAVYITKYIHRNPTLAPGGYKNYGLSSYSIYSGEKTCEWLNTTKVLDMFDNKKEYLSYVDDDEGNTSEVLPSNN